MPRNRRAPAAHPMASDRNKPAARFDESTSSGGSSMLQVSRIASRCILVAAVLGLALPDLALAQAASPFLTGATALQSNILAWLTPAAVILVMVLGVMAMANRISWGWCLAAILGIAISFGSTQIVAWVRGMFGV